MGRDWIGMFKRGIKKSPRYIAQRILHEMRGQFDRFLAPRRPLKLSIAKLVTSAGFISVEQWWNALAERNYLTPTLIGIPELESICPGSHSQIIAAAERVLAHKVNILGSGLIDLGVEIDWHRDYKTGFRWPPRYCRDIEYNNLGQPSDVKFPWELSRMQWMIPLGQAYALTQDEQYAIAVRQLLEHWISENPYAGSVNWSCTMEVALRILSWTWFFHIFKSSIAWQEAGFRERFLQTIYLHGDFTARNLEKSDINGNHYVADAAGLVFVGLFLGGGEAPQGWLNSGWSILCEELALQVFPDGVDYEASIPYHRLVLELFLFPALYMRRHDYSVPDWYCDRLVAMTKFTAAYSRPNGTVPLWGDADDARALPFGSQHVNDHPYLLGIVGAEFSVEMFHDAFSGSRSEIMWLLGADVAAGLPARDMLNCEQISVAFPDGGFYILRDRKNHVIIDCGPLGLGGRGGHGHNDLLSFEAVLDSVHLVSDCGAYLYTADYHERNRFRSTAYHNTPRVDSEEINRFLRWDYLWFLQNDAIHEVRECSFGTDIDRLVTSHSGYRRLEFPVTPIRSFELDHSKSCLTIFDVFEGEGEHLLEIPIHLAPGVEVLYQKNGRIVLRSNKRDFSLTWGEISAWEMRIETGRVSESYGVVKPTTVLVWQREGLLKSLTISIEPMPLSR